MADHVVPIAIEPFNAYAEASFIYLTDNQERLLVSEGNMTGLSELMINVDTGWRHWHTLHASEVTRTGPVNTHLRASETAITHKFQDIFADFPRSVLTIEDYAALHIAPPVTHRAKRGQIVNIPFAKVYSVGGAKASFIVRTDSHAKRAAMDPLADAVQVKAMLLAPDEANPIDPSKCNLDFSSTAALFSHAFTPADAGKKLACFFRFINLTDENLDGGWSGCITCIIGL